MKKILLAFFSFTFICGPSLGLCAQSNSEIMEIIVTSKIPGPPLWEVYNGANTLWIFGVLSPLPKGLGWDSTRVTNILADADEFLQAPGLEVNSITGLFFHSIGLIRQYRKMRKNAARAKLEELLENDLYQRLLNIKAKYGPKNNGIFRLRPMFAAQELMQALLKKTEFVDSGFITKKIQRLARYYDVPYTRATISIPVKKISIILDEINNIPFTAELACLDKTLEQIEFDQEERKNRTLSWSNGYMADIYRSDFPDINTECFMPLSNGEEVISLVQSAKELWLTNVEKALAINDNTFSLLPMDELVNENGLLEKLRGMGYIINEPK